MRIWDIPTYKLCRQHLLGEHRELHAIWSVIVNNKKGYSNHPEVKRWENNLVGLYIRHEEQVKDMKNRGYNHKSDLDLSNLDYNGFAIYYQLVSIDEQIKILKNKGCNCRV